ncbi:MAG: non-canonical purine NTP pyrophosphatase, partial [Prochlorococcaceae cyanobacterium ETNP1_MAG_9]|nr:non-canonical purine NTP pyrophosphatase [Prochlorococcaceae cyanobacterium ETNP1_MAG_9]
KPRGNNGFGYDPVFEVFGTGLTFAEMEIENKQMLSHRGQAFSLLESELHKLF